MNHQETQLPSESNVVTFLDLLNRAKQVQVDDSPSDTTWETSDVTGDPENEVARFSWVEDGLDFNVVLTEGGIAGGKWVGTSFFCEDNEGTDTQISLYDTVALAP